MRTLLMTACLTTSLSVAVALAQVPDEKTATKPAEDSVPMEVFQGVRNQKKLRPPEFPRDEINSGHDGWVDVSMMVAPDGKPYEIMISESSGNKELEKETLRVAKQWTFKPASLNGQPIDSAHNVRVQFYISDGGARGAQSKFIVAHRSFYKALEADDRVAADAAMAAMHADNTYEDAHYGLAMYAYAHKWGNFAGEYAGLSRAVAAADGGGNFSKPAFVNTLQAFITHAALAKHFAAVMKAWDQLKAAKPDPQVLAELQPIIDKIQALKNDDTAYAISGLLDENGSWHLSLFKKHFHAVVSEGHLSQIKLRCDKKYVFFAYDPELMYRVADSFGKCSIQLVGDPGTKFSLIQS